MGFLWVVWFPSSRNMQINCSSEWMCVWVCSALKSTYVPFLPHVQRACDRLRPLQPLYQPQMSHAQTVGWRSDAYCSQNWKHFRIFKAVLWLDFTEFLEMWVLLNAAFFKLCEVALKSRRSVISLKVCRRKTTATLTRIICALLLLSVPRYIQISDYKWYVMHHSMDHVRISTCTIKDNNAVDCLNG